MRFLGVIAYVVVASGVALMGRLGHTPARYAYVPRHQLRAENEAHETGIGIIDPFRDATDETELCTATHALEPGQAPYECELECGHDTDHSAFGGTVTWPREMAVAR